MIKARKYVVKKRFQGLPKRGDFEIVEYELPPLKDGEILVKVEWISVDPYMRTLNSTYLLPYDQFGFQVAVVEQSKSADYPIGTRVVSHKGWCDYTTINTLEPPDYFGGIYKLPDLKGLPNSLGVGAVGMPGVSAYFGFLEICKPKAGETVVVTGAAGAVGSLVGQIAKIKGCKVIGFAGSEVKVKILEKELGFDKAFNYKTVDVAKALKEAAPEGVDCYFDNVGGEISSIIIGQMNNFGRVAVCGSISTYNEDQTKMPKATVLQPAILGKQLKIEGIHAARWSGRWSEALEPLANWIKEGKIVAKEHITEGFDKAVDAFIGMLVGENIGKAVVKV